VSALPGFAGMTFAERSEARAQRYERFIVRHADRGTEGRDPREISRDELATLHDPMPVLKAIRAKCLDCCCYQEGEVRKCAAIECPLWPFRMGSNPWRAPPSEAKRAASAEAGRRLANLRMVQGKTDEGEVPATLPPGGLHDGGRPNGG
jgi:hypothetical protein